MERILEIASHLALFRDIATHDLKPMLGCLGYHIKQYPKGDYISFDSEPIEYIGIVLSGKVHMIKEDIWGNKTLMAVMGPDGLFGETFSCGTDCVAGVSFYTPEKAQVLFVPMDRVMGTCSSSCDFHHKLIANLVHLIADKNRSLMEKIEVVSKKTLRDKILTYLSLQSQRHHTKIFTIPMGRLELAAYLCADRSALTRELASMKVDGLLDYHKNTFELF